MYPRSCGLVFVSVMYRAGLGARMFVEKRGTDFQADLTVTGYGVGRGHDSVIDCFLRGIIEHQQAFPPIKGSCHFSEGAG